jgi:sensor histidine kinase regulating citrate/malate metabolism
MTGISTDYGSGSNDMRSNRLSLGLKFSLAVTILIVLTMLAVTTLIISYQKESLRQAAFEGNLAMTRNLAHDAEGHLLMFDPLRLNELVSTVQEAASCAYAMIIDRDGLIVAHTRKSRTGKPSSTPIPARKGPSESIAWGTTGSRNSSFPSRSAASSSARPPWGTRSAP